MSWISKVIWLVTLTAFFATSYFTGWLKNLNFIIAEINTEFWEKMPWEFQVMIIGFIVVLVAGFIRVITRD